MNVFILDNCPIVAAQSQCDKHIPKMVVESAQMLSTTHRMLDGVQCIRPSKSGKTNVKYWEIQDDRESLLYKAVHMNHPCTVWTRETSENYLWHYRHFVALCDEYMHRFEKRHLSDKLLRHALSFIPVNITNWGLTTFPLAMKSNPECMFPEDPVKSYRLFYQTKQSRFKMLWNRNRDCPSWFKAING